MTEIFRSDEEWGHCVYGVTLPLRNATKKRMVFSNTILCSSKDLGSSFSKRVIAILRFLLNRVEHELTDLRAEIT